MKLSKDHSYQTFCSVSECIRDISTESSESSIKDIGCFKGKIIGDHEVIFGVWSHFLIRFSSRLVFINVSSLNYKRTVLSLGKVDKNILLYKFAEKNPIKPWISPRCFILNSFNEL